MKLECSVEELKLFFKNFEIKDLKKVNDNFCLDGQILNKIIQPSKND